MMSHPASFFALTWCTWEAVRLGRGAADRAGWLRLGLASGLAVVVRYQNVAALLIPAAAPLNAGYATALFGW